MKLPYEEFDLSGIKTYPLGSRESKVGLAQFATPYKKGDGLGGWMRSLPRLLAAGDFKAVVDALLAARKARSRHHLGPWRARPEDRPVAGDRRPDGARLRVGHCDQRRRRDPRFRNRAVGLDVGRRRRHARARHVRHGRRNRLAVEPRHHRRRGRGPRPRPVGGEVPRRTQAAVRADQHRGDRLAARHPAHGARRHRHRHHPHAPAGVGRGDRRGQPARFQVPGVVGGPPRRRRLSQLRIGGGAAGSVPQGRGDRAQRRAARSIG